MSLAHSSPQDHGFADGPLPPVVRCEHVVVPVLPRSQHEVGEPVQKLERCEIVLATPRSFHQVGDVFVRWEALDAGEA